MKLLIVTDYSDLVKEFEKSDSAYRFNSIAIDFVEMKSQSDLNSLEQTLSQNRYHLVLCISKAKFIGKFLKDLELANAINNYSFNGDELDLKNNIVNKTTSYFNVFLEITKAVSLTGTDDVSNLGLKRLDVISMLNHDLALLLNEYRTNYYLLNYKDSFPTERIIDILKKLE